MESLSMIFLILLGLAMLLCPELLWKVEHFLTVKNGEPSEFYLTMMKIGGTIFTVVGVILLIGFAIL